MRIITNFSEARWALNRFIPPSPGVTRYSLDQMTALMNYLGNPQNKLKVIHIAGTSGKTSTSYFVASLLRAAGHTVGLTVSPHIDEINERAQINLLPLPERDYCQELGLFLDIVDASGLIPSYFEILVAFAYWLFYKRQVEYTVVEVGLGGLLDATNVINRSDKVCVITDIGLDHLEVLGNTIDAIAWQKAGIIGPRNTVIMHRQDIAVVTVIETKARAKGADLHIVEPNLPTDDDRVVSLPLFQRRNFHLALQAVDCVLNRDDSRLIFESEIKAASGVYIPARMEIVPSGDKTIILDGSHNEQKIGALVESLQQQFPATPMALLVSFGKNKQSSAADSLKLLRSLGSTIVITRFEKGQDTVGASIDSEILATYAKAAGFKTVIVELQPQRALRLLQDDPATIGLITGSFYLLNHFRPLVLKSLVSTSAYSAPSLAYEKRLDDFMKDTRQR